MRLRVLVLCLALVAVALACGIPDSGDVSRIPPNKIEALNATVPTTSTTTTTIPVTTLEPTTTTQPEITVTTIAQQEFTLYFISGDILRPLTRSLSKGASAYEVIRSLQDGPPVGDVGLRSAVPPYGVSLLNVSAEDGSGVAKVDLPANFFQIVQPPEDQRLAIGQIVLTLTQIQGIGQVLFTQGGEPISVPRGAGDLSQSGVPLPARDYTELLQAPVTTTTTVAVESSVPTG